MKKYLVIGNPIEHSLSPKLHNYWFKKNNIIAQYEKRKLSEKDFQNIIDDLGNPENPKTAVGFLVAGLRNRYLNCKAPFTILSGFSEVQ